MSFQDGGLGAEEVEGQTDARGHPAAVPNVAYVLDLPPVPAEAEAEAEVDPGDDLPGVLGEPFDSCVRAVEVIALVLVGDVVSRVVAIVLIVAPVIPLGAEVPEGG